jgi:hypothetical protein
MKAIVLYRTAAVLLLLFALGHTFGFLRFTPTTTEGRAVQSAMNNVRLVTNADFTYGKFYTGFGLFATTYLLFSAFLAWYLGGLTSKHPESAGTLEWSFFATQLVCLVLSWMYFSVAPAALSAVVAVCLGWAAWLSRERRLLAVRAEQGEMSRAC